MWSESQKYQKLIKLDSYVVDKQARIFVRGGRTRLKCCKTISCINKSAPLSGGERLNQELYLDDEKEYLISDLSLFLLNFVKFEVS